MPINPNNLAATATLTFDDEFATTPLSLWNGKTGTWDTVYNFASQTGNGATLTSNGEQEWYINNNYAPTASVVPWYIANGVLNIVAKPAPTNIQPLIDNYKYTSGVLQSSRSFSQTYGFFEISAKLPAGQGLWPAFWMLPESGQWPPELDIMEVLGQTPTALYTSAHSAAPGIPGLQAWNSTVANTSTGFHTYGVDWEPDDITWYFDGQAVYRVATPPDMDQPMYMLLDLAVGGSFPGDVNSTTPFPADMQVQWVRAYQSVASAPVETSPITAVAAMGSGTVIKATGASVALAGGATETSAAMLSDGEIALAGALSGGAGLGALFTASGAAIGSTIALQGFDQNGLDPQITVLNGGMWQVTYAEPGAPNELEVYDASGTRVFIDNAFVTGSPIFAALTTGGWVETSTNWTPNFELVDASGKINWIALPTSASGAALQPTAIQPLSDGGFVFSYAGSAELDRYNFSGGVHTTIKLSSIPTHALTVAGFSDLVTEAAWVDHTGYLMLEAFGPSGSALGSALVLHTSVDAGTQLQLLQTGVVDDSVLLWSSGGYVHGASFNGVTASSVAVLVPAALSAVQDVVLSNGEIAMSWVETDNGAKDAWAGVLNPTTMQMTKHNLGVSAGSIHLLALPGGGFAESWHTKSGIEAVAYDGLGHYGAAIAVIGDFLGLNSAGQAVAVGISPNGQAELQAYSFSADPPATTAAAMAAGLMDLWPLSAQSLASGDFIQA